ncbi:unknown [Clostridium sp. CAG:306]|nr:unknown [Clostridium sp. CAG:306]
MLKDETLEIIAEWLYHNEKMKEINKYLFDHTELYEQKYMTDFRDSLFRFFAGKITRFSKDYNKIYELLNKDEKQRLNKIRMLRR